MADAINSLSDNRLLLFDIDRFLIAASRRIEHPYGHERFEYISGFVVSLLITFVGFQFQKMPLKKSLLLNRSVYHHGCLLC